MNKETAASSVRYEAAATEIAYDAMRRSSFEQRAEAIAKHYAANATLALNLLELIRARQQSNNPAYLDFAIAHCVEEIQRSHKYGFGIELKWPDRPLQ